MSVHDAFEVQMSIEKLKRHKVEGIDQIPTEVIKARCRSEVHKLINSIWNKEDWPEQWKASMIATTCKKSDRTDCRNISLCQLHIKFFQLPAVKFNSICRLNYWGSSGWIFT